MARIMPVGSDAVGVAIAAVASAGVKEWLVCSLLCAVPAVLRRSGVELEAAAGAPYEMFLSPLFAVPGDLWPRAAQVLAKAG